MHRKKRRVSLAARRMPDYLPNCFSAAMMPCHDAKTASFVRHGWDSQVYPGVKPRPPDGTLLPAGKRSGTVCHLHLSQEKKHETRLWWDAARHSRPDAFRLKNGGPIPRGGVDAANEG